MNKMYIISMLMVLWACNEPIVPPIEPDPKPWQPEIVWKRQHGPTKFDQLAFRIVLYKDKLLAGYQSAIGSGYWVYDKNTGVVLHDIKDQFSFNLETASKLINNLYHTNTREYRTINLDNYEVKTGPLIDQGISPDGRKNVLDDYVYVGGWHTMPPDKITFHRTKVDELDKVPWETVVTDIWPDDVTGAYMSAQFCSGLRKNDIGEHILYYGSSQLYNGKLPTDARIRFSAYNVDKIKMLWQTDVERKSVDEDPLADDGGGPHTPYFYQDKVIMISARYVRAFDQNNGKLIWQQNLKYITTTDYAVIDNHLFICDNVGLLYKIDINSGRIVSTLQMKNGNTGVWQEYKGILYFTTASGNLWAVDAEKMEVKWKWKSENSQICSYCSFGNNSPVIDKETNRLYITDGRDMFCIKLPE